MFNKRLLVFLVYGIMIFVASLAAMLGLGHFMPGQPPVQENSAVGVAQPIHEYKIESVHKSKISKVIEKMYYEQLADNGHKTDKSKKQKLYDNTEVLKLLTEVSKLKKEYELNVAELNGKEEDFKEELVSEREKIDLIKKELDKELEMINETKLAIQDNMVVMNDEESNNMKLLATIYEGMKPKRAASIISKMDNQTAVKLLKLMDQRNSAKILQDVDSAMAVKLSERIRGNKIEKN